MNCPKCGEEMKKGFLFATKDGAFSFANEVPGMMKNARMQRVLSRSLRQSSCPA